MKKTKTWWSALLFVITAEYLAVAAPRIQCDAPDFDFGKLDNSETINHSFIIKNIGNEPLQIINVKACCGAAALAKDSVVAPGLSTEIRVKGSLYGRQGQQLRTVTLYSNDPDHPQFECHLTGLAVAIAEKNPPQSSRSTLPDSAYGTQDLVVLPKETQITQEEFSSSNPIMKSVVVRSISNQPFTVVKGEIPGVDAIVKISPLGSQGTRITWVSRQREAFFTEKKLTITIKLGEKKTTLESLILIPQATTLSNSK